MSLNSCPLSPDQVGLHAMRLIERLAGYVCVAAGAPEGRGAETGLSDAPGESPASVHEGLGLRGMCTNYRGCTQVHGWALEFEDGGVTGLRVVVVPS